MLVPIYCHLRGNAEIGSVTRQQAVNRLAADIYQGLFQGPVRDTVAA